MKNHKKGSIEAFDQNWRERKESYYNHYVEGKAINQIQFAFKNHFNVFNELVFNKKQKYKILEVGCGRGTLSSYFANEGHECHLLDTSKGIIDIAKKIFKKNNHKAKFYVQNGENTSFEDNSFDIVFSIGLMEHFKKIDKILDEKLRILKKGGSLFLYVVPEYFNKNIQKKYKWFNDLLKLENTSDEIIKQDVYRSDANSTKYINYLKNKTQEIYSSGIYSVPMISPSIDFPFTLMNEKQENILINYYETLLKKRQKKYPTTNPWLCEEGYGQAFLIWAKK